MTNTAWRNLSATLLAPLALLIGAGCICPAHAQNPELQQRVAKLKQTLSGPAELRQFEWIEATVISLKGEEKSREQKQCYYGAEGSIQKVEVSESPRRTEARIEGPVIEKKKAELTDYMKRAVALVKTYVPPTRENPGRKGRGQCQRGFARWGQGARFEPSQLCHAWRRVAG